MKMNKGAELVLIAEVHYGGEENFGEYEYQFSIMYFKNPRGG